MRQSGEHNFEEEWKKALADAVEPPPVELWSKIEAQLPSAKRQGAVVPLWRHPTLLWSLVAGVAAVLAVGLWLMPTDEVPEPERPLARQGEVAPAPELRSDPLPNVQAPTPQIERDLSRAIASLENSLLHTEAVVLSVPSGALVTPPDTLTGDLGEVAIAKSSPTKNESMPTRTGDELADFSAEQLRAIFRPSDVSGLGIEPGSVPLPAPPRPVVSGLADAPLRAASFIERPMAGFPSLSLRPTESLTAVEKTANSQEAMEPSLETLLPTPRKKSFWAGVAFLPSWFNPRVALRVATAGQSQALVGIAGGASFQKENITLAGENTPRFSYAVQGQIGKKLSKHWSIETGVSYLEGQSMFSHPGSWSDPSGGQYYLANYDLLESALIKSNKNVFRTSAVPETVSIIEEDLFARISTTFQQTPNSYRYLQVPIQLGYELAPSHRLSYTLLAGIVGNLFLQNTIETARGEALTTRAQDGVYSTLHAGATAGLRLNYALSPTLTASLTGSYQQALSRAAQEESALTAQPQLYGVGWGVRYQF